MKKILVLLLALLVTSSVWAATKVQVMTDGVIDVDRLPTISFFQESDPTSPELGQIWWNNSTAQLKVAGALGVYAFNSTSLVEWDTTPEAFSFTDITDATTETVYTSDAITVSGINWPAAISVSGDASAKYSINNTTATASAGTVESGDEVRAVVTSSASAATAVNATVTIGGVSDAYSVTTAASESVTYLVDEDFEGTGAPSGWTLSLANADYATSPLSGAQSLAIGNGVTFGSATSPTFATQGTAYIYFMYSQSALSTASYDILRLLSGTNQAARLQVTAGGGLKVLHGTSSDTGSDGVIAADTTYHIWVYFEGSSNSISVYISETSSRPATPEVTVVGGSGAYATIDNVQFKNCSPAYSYFDDVKISANGW